MDPISTVNVIDVRDPLNMGIMAMKSFPDNDEGNKAAEAIFREWVTEQHAHEVSEEDMQGAIDDGYFEIGIGYIVIVHST